MSSTTDEDWSIISSSDYEDDSSSASSVSRHGHSKDDADNCNYDLAAASVSTVRPDSKSDTFAGLQFGASCVSNPDLAQGGGSALRSNVASRSGSDSPHECETGGAPGTQQTLAAPSERRFAQMFGPCAAARQAKACAHHYLRETNFAVKTTSREIFNRPLASLRTRCERFPTSPLRTASLRTLRFLESQKQFLLYFVLLAAITTVTGGCITASFWTARHSYTGPAPSIGFFSEGFSKQPSYYHGGNHNARLWAQKANVHFVEWKNYVLKQSSNLVDLILYENRREIKEGWFGHRYQQASTRELRIHKLWTGLSNHSWRVISAIGESQILVALGEQFSMARISATVRSIHSEIRNLASDPVLKAQIEQRMSNLVVFGTRSTHVLKDLSMRRWVDLKYFWNYSSRAGSGILVDVWESTSVSIATIKKQILSSVYSLNTRKEYFMNNLEFCALYSSKVMPFFRSMASDFQAHLDARMNSTYSTDLLKETSMNGLSFLNKRLQMAALDAYRFSKFLTESVRRSATHLNSP